MRKTIHAANVANVAKDTKRGALTVKTRAVILIGNHPERSAAKNLNQLGLGSFTAFRMTSSFYMSIPIPIKSLANLAKDVKSLRKTNTHNSRGFN
jgi:hypothetical protein